MATFEIRKKNSSDIWEHIWLGAELNLILSDGYFRMVDDTFQLYGSSSGNMRYAPLSEIVLYDETASGIPETFTDVLTFVTRLRSLNYPYFYQKALNTTSVESIFGRGGNVVSEIGDYSASQINNDSNVFGATVLDALQYLEGLISPSNGDMLKSVYDPNEVEGDAFDMDNMSQGVTNQFISQSDRTLLNNTSGTNTGDQDLSNYIQQQGSISGTEIAVWSATDKKIYGDSNFTWNGTEFKINTTGNVDAFIITNPSLVSKPTISSIMPPSTSTLNGRAWVVGEGGVAYDRIVLYSNASFGLGFGGGSATRDVFVKRISAGVLGIDGDGSGGTANLQVSGSVTGTSILVTGKTSDDILLGDGSTTSLAAISGSITPPTLQQVILEGNSSTLPVIIDNKNTTPTQFFGSALLTVESLMDVNGTSVGAAFDYYRDPTADSSGSDIYATFNRLVSDSDFRDGRLQAFYSQAKYGGTAGLDTSMYGGRLESIFEGSGGIGSGTGSSNGFLIGVRSYTANRALDNSNINCIRAYDSEAVMDSTNGTIDYLQGHHNNVTLIKGTVNNDVSINYLDFDYTDGVVNGDFAYITTKDTGIDFSFVNGTARFIDSLVPLPSRFGGSIESTKLIVTGKTSDDILLGDGSTTSLSGISAFSGDYNDLTNKPTTITVGQANEISANTLKVSYTDAAEVSANTLKNSYPSSDATKLGNIEDNAQVNVQADWNATSGDALILNKPTIPTAFSGDYNDLSNKPVTITGTNLEVGDGTITNTKVNGSLALGTDVAFQKLHIVDGNVLLQAGGEVAFIMKRDVTFTNSHSNSPFVNPIFQIGRIIQGGDGAPQFRWMYSDDNVSETVVMELDSEGIMSSVRQERGSHFEAHIEGEANPFFRLNSSPDMRLEMGAGGIFTTDVAVCRSATETLSFCVGSGASEEQVINIKSTGAEYSKDYSSSYTSRSLIDKAHLDSKLFTEKSFTINDPINEIIPLFVLGQSITISELRVAKLGSSDVEYKLGFGSSLGTVDTDITANQTQSSSSSTLVNSFSNDTVSANEFVFLQIVNANSATQFHITIKYN